MSINVVPLSIRLLYLINGIHSNIWQIMRAIIVAISILFCYRHLRLHTTFIQPSFCQKLCFCLIIWTTRTKFTSGFFFIIHRFKYLVCIFTFETVYTSIATFSFLHSCIEINSFVSLAGKKNFGILPITQKFLYTFY